jgi:hypothetical protein
MRGCAPALATDMRGPEDEGAPLMTAPVARSAPVNRTGGIAEVDGTTEL